MDPPPDLNRDYADKIKVRIIRAVVGLGFAAVTIVRLSIFPTSLFSERAFSGFNFANNKYRNKLTKEHLGTSLVLALEKKRSVKKKKSFSESVNFS